MLLGIESVSVTSLSLARGQRSRASSPARHFSMLVKEAGPGAFRTSNTASASASLTSAILARSAGSSGRSAPQSRQSVCSGSPNSASPRSRRALAAYLGLPSPCAQCMRAARSGISVAASSPASSILSQRYRFARVGKRDRRRHASATLMPLSWNSQSIPSRSSLVYIGLPPGPNLVRVFVRGPLWSLCPSRMP